LNRHGNKTRPRQTRPPRPNLTGNTDLTGCGCGGNLDF